MENKPILGKLLKGDEERDAIHIAILPAIAEDYISPGRYIQVKPDGWARESLNSNDINAIADPFLPSQICPNQRFYALLFPYTIQSLRHEWVHKDFPKPYEPKSDLLQFSIDWMRNLADHYARREPDPYVWLMNEADKIVWGIESYIVFSVDCHGEIDPQEFWKHYQTIRGTLVNLDITEDIFSCSC